MNWPSSITGPLPMIGLGHQTSHKTFNLPDLQSILPTSCMEAMQAEILWEWPLFLNSQVLQPKKISQWLRALDALPKDTGLTFSIYVADHNCLQLQP